jgi:hypothetical protein
LIVQTPQLDGFQQSVRNTHEQGVVHIVPHMMEAMLFTALDDATKRRLRELRRQAPRHLT